MTDWNYFLVNICLSFNFLINPVCSRKEGDSATVFLTLFSQVQITKLLRNILWKQGLNHFSTPSTPEQTLSFFFFFFLVAEAILSVWHLGVIKHLYKE